MFDKKTVSNKKSSRREVRNIVSYLIKETKVFLYSALDKLKNKLEFAYVE